MFTFSSSHSCCGALACTSNSYTHAHKITSSLATLYVYILFFFLFPSSIVITSRPLWLRLRLHIRAKKVSNWIRWILNGERWTRSGKIVYRVSNSNCFSGARRLCCFIRSETRKNKHRTKSLDLGTGATQKKKQRSRFVSFFFAQKNKNKNQLVTSTIQDYERTYGWCEHKIQVDHFLPFFFRFFMRKFRTSECNDGNAIRLK